MTRKRGSKKKGGGSNKKKQLKQQQGNDSVPDLPASESAEQEQPLLQADQAAAAAVHWTSPDTIPVEHAVSTTTSSSTNVMSNRRSNSKNNTPAMTFFSPPVPDFNSMISPQARPIHTPYSSRRQPLSSSAGSNNYYYSDSEDCASSSSASEASPAGSTSNTPSARKSHHHGSSRSSAGLRDQVRDLDNLLTSPLTAHLGNLADGTTPANANSTLGPMMQGGEDDDMSAEWDHLQESELLLRQELESFDMGPALSTATAKAKTKKEPQPPQEEFLSVPPGIARQRLDPMASPLHPYALFPHNKNTTTTTPAPNKTPNNKTIPKEGTLQYSSGVKEEKKEESPAAVKKLKASPTRRISRGARTGPAYTSPPRPKKGSNSSKSHIMNSPKDPSQSALNINSSSSSNHGMSPYRAANQNVPQSTTPNKTRNHHHPSGISNVSSTTSSAEQLGQELDQLVNSMVPLFDDSTDDAAALWEFNNLSNASSTNQSSSNKLDHPQQQQQSFVVNSELSQLVHSVQEQLEKSAAMPDTPPTTTTTKDKNKKPTPTRVIVTESKPPDVSMCEIIWFDNNSDDDDDMSAEMNQLGPSESLLRETLASYDDEQSLVSRPTPKSPPQLTDDLIQNGSQDEKRFVHPVPIMPRNSASPQRQQRREKDHNKQHLNIHSSATGSTATTVTTIGGSPMESGSPLVSEFPGDGTMTSSQAAVKMHSSSSGTPTSYATHPSPISNDTSGAVVMKPTYSLPSKGSNPRPAPQQRHPTTPGSSREVEIPPAILTPEQVDKLQLVTKKESVPTPPSGVARTRAESRHSPRRTSYSTPTRQHNNNNSASNGTPSGRNTTPGSLSSRGSAVKTLLIAPCTTALDRLVRTPSPDNAEEGHHGASASRPFQFEEGDSSSDSSQSLVPFSPDELNFRQQQHSQYYPGGETIAKGTVSWEKEFEIESSPQQTGNIEMSELQKSDHEHRGQTGYWISYRYDRQQEAAKAVDNTSEGPDTEPRKMYDLLSNSQTRMKELQQQLEQREIEMQQLKKSEQAKRHSASGHHSDSEVMSTPASRRRQLRLTKDPLSTSFRDLKDLPISPIGKGRRQSFSHGSPRRKSMPNPPSPARSVDAWRIQSRADGRKSTSTLDAVLAELSEYRPKTTARPPKVSPSKSVISTSSRGLKSEEPSPTKETSSIIYMNVPSKVYTFEGDDKPLFLDVEDPDSSKPLDGETANASKTRRRVLLCGAICIVWLIVVAIITTLAVLFTRGRGVSPSSSSLRGEAPVFNNATEPPSVSPATVSSPTIAPDLSVPTNNIFTSAPAPMSGTMTMPTASPTRQPRPSPIVPPPTPRPTGALRPVTDTTMSLISLLVSRSVDLGEALLDRASPEYASLQWLSGNAFLDSYSDQQKVQRFVLGTVYYSLNGDFWTLHDRWLTDVDECRWFSRARRFPVCNAAGNYVSLELGYVDATGTLPKALGMLSNSLERIDIQGGPRAFLTGTLPSELGLLTLMREFRVSNNELEGRVPLELHRWNFLQALDLNGNMFSGSLPFVAGKWSELSEMDLGQNYFGGSLQSDIGLCEQLRELSIGDNLLTGAVPSEIGLLTNLQDLMLEQNSFDMLPSEIGKLNKMETLMLFTNRLSNSIPTEIGRLQKMRAFSVAFNMLQGSIPSELGRLADARDRLDLSYNRLTGRIPSEIGKLKQLKHLLLHTNQLSGSVPPEVASLDRLNTFRIDSNNLSGGVPADVCEVFNSTLPYFYADCSEIDCPCCLFCCVDGDGCACRYENTVNQYLCF